MSLAPKTGPCTICHSADKEADNKITITCEDGYPTGPNIYHFDLCDECYEIFAKRVIPGLGADIMVHKAEKLMEKVQRFLHLSKQHTKVLLKWLEKARSCGVHGHRDHGYCYSVEEIKKELAKREHVPNKAEAKKLRQELAKKKKNR